MKKIIVMAAALMYLAPTSLFAGDSNEEILQMLKQLQTTVEAQQSQINGLQSQLKGQNTPVSNDREVVSEIVREEVENAVETAIDERIEAESFSALKQAGDVLKLGKAEGLELKGDIRLRYERREESFNGSKDDAERDRFRQRVRIGLKWKNEDWAAGIGLATGSLESNSTNDTFSEGDVFETNEINLDYAYVAHNWDNVSLTLGQQKNPFLTTDRLWDSDIRPAGATLAAESGSLFATGGIYDVRHLGTNEADSMLYALQGGLKFESESASGLLAIGYFHFNEPTFGNEISKDSDVAIGVLSESSVTDPRKLAISNAFEDLDFHLFDIYGELGNDLGTLYGQYTKNLGSDADAETLTFDGVTGFDSDEDTAWVLGAKTAFGKLSLGYEYAYIETFSTFPEITDSDFGTGVAATDVEGHVFKAKYKLTSNLSLSGAAMFYEPIDMDNVSGEEDEGSLYQLNLEYKF
ncbi:MAG: hypothetical protein ACI8W8_001228 [Rhodothermales bacterium]|jgi:hypothetical protein